MENKNEIKKYIVRKWMKKCNLFKLTYMANFPNSKDNTELKHHVVLANSDGPEILGTVTFSEEGFLKMQGFTLRLYDRTGCPFMHHIIQVAPDRVDRDGPRDVASLVKFMFKSLYKNKKE